MNAEILRNLEKEQGFPGGYLEKVIRMESSWDPKAKNKSGATGLYQFMPSTWEQYGGEGDPTDPVAATDAMVRFTRDNMNNLKKRLGRDPEAHELYLAHQQGVKGAVDLIKNPNALASEVRGAPSIMQNGGKENMTSKDFMGMVYSKFGDPSRKEVEMPEEQEIPEGADTDSIRTDLKGALIDPKKPRVAPVQKPKELNPFEKMARYAFPTGYDKMSAGISELRADTSDAARDNYHGLIGGVLEGGRGILEAGFGDKTDAFKPESGALTNSFKETKEREKNKSAYQRLIDESFASQGPTDEELGKMVDLEEAGEAEGLTGQELFNKANNRKDFDWEAFSKMLQSIKPKGTEQVRAPSFRATFRAPDSKLYSNELLTREFSNLYNQPLYNKLG